MSGNLYGSETASVALAHVEQGEDANTTRRDKKNRFDFEDFLRSIITYLAIAIMMFAALALLTLFDTGTVDFGTNMFRRIDVLNLMFSLILSAALEQIWNNKRELRYKITMILEVVLSALGFIWYIARSFADIIIQKSTDTEYVFESFFQDGKTMFWFNVLYTIVGAIVIICGFAFRAYREIDK